jgi:GLPGLI family protein
MNACAGTVCWVLPGILKINLPRLQHRQNNNTKIISMKYKIVCFTILAAFAIKTNAQQFISKGTIEFEVITNVKKTMGNSFWAEQLKDQMPAFKTAYYNFSFADNKSYYKFDHYDEKKAKVPEFLRRGEDDNEWFNDFTTGQTYIQKNMFGTLLNLKDSIAPIHWKITNESRLIAGFNCRKAIGKILDSVYVFAFYTDEITISGGPCTINGLPGMILGVTIPRLYASMIATKLVTADVKENNLKPVIVKKYYTAKQLKAILDEKIKDFGNDQDEDSKKWISQLYWNALL